MKLKAKVNSGHKAPISRCQFRSRILSFLLLNILLSCTFSLADEQRFSILEPEVCEEINSKSGCQCDKFFPYLKIMCPKPLSIPNRTKITFFAHLIPSSDSFLEIECSHMNSKDYAVVLKMSFDYVKSINMNNCPLPEDASIADIFEKIGATNVEKLFYGGSNLDSNLTRLHLNGLKNLTFLSLRFRNLAHLPEDLFHDLGNLNFLYFGSHNVEVPANILVPLENLSWLELADSNLKILPAGIFRNHHKLIHLGLWGNKLSQLTKGTFESLSSLSSLDLSSNSIETLEPNIFEFLTNLSIINLNSNRIKELPKGLFAYTKKLKEFSLRNNYEVLSSLPDGLLSDLPMLKTVSLNCYLEVIPANVFANSTSIEEISLEDNHLITLPEILFHDQVNLRELDLSNNRLTALPDNLFKNNENLKLLKLLQNQLKEIKSYILRPLRSLEQLYMNNNHLISIDSEAFLNSYKLRNLHLQNNRINLTGSINEKSISPFRFLFKLEVLNLRNNSLRYLFGDVRPYLISLETLDLSYNKISSVDYKDLQYNTTSQLTVDMTHNEISSINFMNLSYVNVNQKLTLDLNNNPLNCDCTVLEFVQFLRGDLSKNLAVNIKLQTDNLVCQKPENLKNEYVRDISYTELLCALDYEDSKNRFCPENCECSKRTYDLTIIIDCSQGNRTEIPELPSAKDLNFKAIELNMSNNNLIRLPTKANHTGYSEVTKLILAGNKLQELNTENLPMNLTHLDLRFNEFKLLSDSVLTVFKKSTLQTLYLSENPWQCDCEAKTLLQYAQSNFKKVRDYSEMRCGMPNSCVKFRHLSVSNICEDDKTLLNILLATLAVFFLLIALISVLYLNYQIEIKVWLYAHKMCLWFVTEKELDKDKIYDAFVSYSSKDEDFVVKHLVPNLENGTPAFKICVHYRDFLVGENISINIANAVENSRRTIVLLSKNFLESSWARHEFRSAHLAALDERKPKVIVILYGDIGNIDDLDSELKAYLKTNTYLQWNDPLFWERLRYAMPHSRLRTNAPTRNQMQISVDDNFELINTTPVTPPLTTQPSNTTKNPLIAHLNNGLPQTANGKLQNGHINGAFIINPNSKESDV